VALHKAKLDARQSAAHHKMARTMDGMREGVLLLLRRRPRPVDELRRRVLSGWSLLQAKGKLMTEILKLSDANQRSPKLLEHREDAVCGRGVWLDAPLSPAAVSTLVISARRSWPIMRASTTVLWSRSGMPAQRGAHPGHRGDAR